MREHKYRYYITLHYITFTDMKLFAATVTTDNPAQCNCLLNCQISCKR